MKSNTEIIILVIIAVIITGVLFFKNKKYGLFGYYMWLSGFLFWPWINRIWEIITN